MSGDLLGAALAARAGARAMVLTGGIGVGKTRAVLTLAGDLRRQHLRVGGVASPWALVGGETVGYRVRDLTTGEEHPLCSRPAPGLPSCRFTFSPEGLAFANAVLARATREAEVIVVDEVGPLELSGGGFTPGLRAALGSPAFLILTTRPALVDEVRAWAGLAGVPTIELGERPPALRTLAETQHLFDAAAEHCARPTGSTGPLTGYADSLARAATLVTIAPGERILDIGIGTGAFACRVAVPGVEVWGVDPSPTMLTRCQKEHPDYHLREGHFLALPVPDGAFHAVLSSFAFHHLAPTEYEPAFAEITRVLEPGRRFALLDILFTTEQAREEARVILGDLWDDEETYPLTAEVVQAAESAGAVDVAPHRVGRLHWAITGTRPHSPVSRARRSPAA